MSGMASDRPTMPGNIATLMACSSDRSFSRSFSSRSSVKMSASVSIPGFVRQ